MEKTHNSFGSKQPKSPAPVIAGKACADTKPAVPGKSDKVESKNQAAPAGLAPTAKA